MKNRIIEGEKMYLRLMTPEDTDLIVKWRNTDNVRRYFIYQEEFTEEGHLNWIKTMIDTGKAIQFIIVEKQSDKPIGSVYFRDISKQHQRAEYGIFIGEQDIIGKGYGTEAACLAVKYGFYILHLHKIMLRVFADNERAIRSYEKAGFVREGYLKDEVCIKGQYRDIVLMGMINNEE